MCASCARARAQVPIHVARGPVPEGAEASTFHIRRLLGNSEVEDEAPVREGLVDNSAAYAPDIWKSVDGAEKKAFPLRAKAVAGAQTFWWHPTHAPTDR